MSDDQHTAFETQKIDRKALRESILKRAKGAGGADSAAADRTSRLASIASTHTATDTAAAVASTTPLKAANVVEATTPAAATPGSVDRESIRKRAETMRARSGTGDGGARPGANSVDKSAAEGVAESTPSTTEALQSNVVTVEGLQSSVNEAQVTYTDSPPAEASLSAEPETSQAHSSPSIPAVSSTSPPPEETLANGTTTEGRNPDLEAELAAARSDMERDLTAARAEIEDLKKQCGNAQQKIEKLEMDLMVAEDDKSEAAARHSKEIAELRSDMVAQSQAKSAGEGVEDEAAKKAQEDLQVARRDLDARAAEIEKTDAEVSAMKTRVIESQAQLERDAANLKSLKEDFSTERKMFEVEKKGFLTLKDEFLKQRFAFDKEKSDLEREKEALAVERADVDAMRTSAESAGAAAREGDEQLRVQLETMRHEAADAARKHSTEMNDVSAEISNLKQRNAELEAERKSALNDVDKLKKRDESMAAELTKAKQALSDSALEISKLKSDLKAEKAKAKKNGLDKVNEGPGGMAQGKEGRRESAVSNASAASTESARARRNTTMVDKRPEPDEMKEVKKNQQDRGRAASNPWVIDDGNGDKPKKTALTRPNRSVSPASTRASRLREAHRRSASDISIDSDGTGVTNTAAVPGTLPHEPPASFKTIAYTFDGKNMIPIKGSAIPDVPAASSTPRRNSKVPRVAELGRRPSTKPDVKSPDGTNIASPMEKRRPSSTQGAKTKARRPPSPSSAVPPKAPVGTLSKATPSPSPPPDADKAASPSEASPDTKKKAHPFALFLNPTPNQVKATLTPAAALAPGTKATAAGDVPPPPPPLEVGGVAASPESPGSASLPSTPVLPDVNDGRPTSGSTDAAHARAIALQAAGVVAKTPTQTEFV